MLCCCSILALFTQRLIKITATTLFIYSEQSAPHCDIYTKRQGIKQRPPSNGVVKGATDRLKTVNHLLISFGFSFYSQCDYLMCTDLFFGGGVLIWGADTKLNHYFL